MAESGQCYKSVILTTGDKMISDFALGYLSILRNIIKLDLETTDYMDTTYMKVLKIIMNNCRNKLEWVDLGLTSYQHNYNPSDGIHFPSPLKLLDGDLRMCLVEKELMITQRKPINVKIVSNAWKSDGFLAKLCQIMF